MKRSGFTMIELIFVIVILGILASVAIPKLAATRDDAKIAAVAQQVQSAVGEIPAYVTSQGRVDGMVQMSQVLEQLNEQGKLVKSGTTTKAASTDTNVTIRTLKNDGTTYEDCFTFAVDANATNFFVTPNTSATDKICKGVQARITGGTFQIGGATVKF